MHGPLSTHPPDAMHTYPFNSHAFTIPFCTPAPMSSHAPIPCPPAKLFPTHLFPCPPIHLFYALPPTYSHALPPTYSHALPPTHLFPCPPTDPPVPMPSHRPTCSHALPPTHLFLCPPTDQPIPMPSHPPIPTPSHPFILMPSNPPIPMPSHPLIPMPSHPLIPMPSHPPTPMPVSMATHPSVSLATNLFPCQFLWPPTRLFRSPPTYSHASFYGHPPACFARHQPIPMPVSMATHPSVSLVTNLLPCQFLWPPTRLFRSPPTYSHASFYGHPPVCFARHQPTPMPVSMATHPSVSLATNLFPCQFLWPPTRLFRSPLTYSHASFYGHPPVCIARHQPIPMPVSMATHPSVSLATNLFPCQFLWPPTRLFRSPPTYSHASFYGHPPVCFARHQPIPMPVSMATHPSVSLATNLLPCQFLWLPTRLFRLPNSSRHCDRPAASRAVPHVLNESAIGIATCGMGRAVSPLGIAIARSLDQHSEGSECLRLLH